MQINKSQRSNFDNNVVYTNSTRRHGICAGSFNIVHTLIYNHLVATKRFSNWKL